MERGAQFKISLEGVWTNLLSITFKSTNQFCYCQLNRVSTPLGFLLVLRATLGVRHRSALTRETPQCLTKLLPSPDESKAYIFSTMKALSAVVCPSAKCHPVLVKLPFFISRKDCSRFPYIFSTSSLVFSCSLPQLLPAFRH